MSKFNNTKVRVCSDEECAKIQKAMFKEGFGWGRGEKKKVQILEARFLFFETKCITWCSGGSEDYFKNHLNKEISVEDIFGKLINKETMENIEDFDKKALSDAKKEIAMERAELQKEKAKKVLRTILNKKDEAEDVLKSTTKELEEIDESLKVFDKPKK